MHSKSIVLSNQGKCRISFKLEKKIPQQKQNLISRLEAPMLSQKLENNLAFGIPLGREREKGQKAMHY